MDWKAHYRLRVGQIQSSSSIRSSHNHNFDYSIIIIININVLSVFLQSINSYQKIDTGPLKCVMIFVQCRLCNCKWMPDSHWWVHQYWPKRTNNCGYTAQAFEQVNRDGVTGWEEWGGGRVVWCVFSELLSTAKMPKRQNSHYNGGTPSAVLHVYLITYCLLHLQ